jgi:uncharacterized membrane protein
MTIASYKYKMAYFILRDNPEMKPLDILKKSKNMMRGNKFELFKLDLSFIGWAILSVLPVCLPLPFLRTYVRTSHAAFYDDVK